MATIKKGKQQLASLAYGRIIVVNSLHLSSCAIVHPCACPLSVREEKNDATASEVSVESQVDPVETDANRE